jgi:hypothetical protein
MAPWRATSTLLTILGLGCAVGTALPDVPSRENFLRRVWAEATVLGNYVYIDGGELNQLVDGKSVSGESDVGKTRIVQYQCSTVDEADTKCCY